MKGGREKRRRETLRADSRSRALCTSYHISERYLWCSAHTDRPCLDLALTLVLQCFAHSPSSCGLRAHQHAAIPICWRASVCSRCDNILILFMPPEGERPPLPAPGPLAGDKRCELSTMPATGGPKAPRGALSIFLLPPSQFSLRIDFSETDTIFPSCDTLACLLWYWRGVYWA